MRWSMKKILMIVISLLISIQPAYAQETLQTTAVTIVNENVLAKKEAIDYWLKRMIVGYNSSKLDSYILSTPEPTEMVQDTSKAIAALRNQGLTDEEIAIVEGV